MERKLEMENIPNTSYMPKYKTHLYWGAVIAGALVALGLGFLLQLFGLAIGLSVYHSDTGQNTLAIGGIIGTIIGAIATMGVAGFVSGYYARCSCCERGESLLYGFLTWSVALLLSALLILPLSKYASVPSSTQVSVYENLPQNVIVKNIGSSSPNATTEVKVTPTVLAGGSWLIFILFFIGAISSCVGAACGMNCRLKCSHREVNPSL